MLVPLGVFVGTGIAYALAYVAFANALANAEALLTLARYGLEKEDAPAEYEHFCRAARDGCETVVSRLKFARGVTTGLALTILFFAGLQLLP